MPRKRMRHAGPSTQRAAPLGTNASASRSPAKAMRPSEAASSAQQSRARILNAVSPGVLLQSAIESDRLKMGDFLEKCHYCQKRIPQNSEVFMYSDFCAFCSAECRNFQIAKDQLVETKPANPHENRVAGLWISHGKS